MRYAFPPYIKLRTFIMRRSQPGGIGGRMAAATGRPITLNFEP